MKPVPKSKRWPAIVDLPGIRTALADIDAAVASPGTKCASRFLALTAQRPGMVRPATWSEIEGVDCNAEVDREAMWRVLA